VNTLDELNAGAAAKALDDIGELIDQLAGSAREFDFNTANRMERDAAKALLIIEGAINALPGLLDRVERLEAALKPFTLVGDNESVGDMEIWTHAFYVGDIRRARAALKEQTP
jgi:hypothetical protein